MMQDLMLISEMVVQIMMQLKPPLFNAFHNEDANTGLGYETGQDLAQSTSFQNISLAVGADNDK